MSLSDKPVIENYESGGKQSPAAECGSENHQPDGGPGIRADSHYQWFPAVRASQWKAGCRHRDSSVLAVGSTVKNDDTILVVLITPNII